MENEELINLLNKSSTCKMRIVSALYEAAYFFNEKNMVFSFEEYEKNIKLKNEYINRLK